MDLLDKIKLETVPHATPAQRKKISVGMLSLGCPKTLVDSELILGELDQKRFQIAEQVSNCDVALLNTCAFIQDAKEESIDQILQLLELKKEGKIKALIVLGCLAQRYSKELVKELQEVDAFLGTGEYAKVPKVVERILGKVFSAESSRSDSKKKSKPDEPLTLVGRPGYLYTDQNKRVALTPKHFRYVKISEGCNQRCSFCTIPAFRGKHRSRPLLDIVREVEGLAKEGCKEIVITGQDTTQYGKDLSGKFILPELLRELSQIRGIEWIRLLYAYPALIGDELIKTLASVPKICHYLDVPLQHISDSILKSMKRGVTKERTIHLMKRLRSEIPDVALRTTLIVGYPGETEAQFEELLQLMEDEKFERLGIFIFSKEEGTLAARMKNQVPFQVQQKRFARAMELQQEISKVNNEKWIGKNLQILIDAPDENHTSRYVGRSYMDAPEVDGTVGVQVARGRVLEPGQFVNVRITGAQEYDLTGELVS